MRKFVVSIAPKAATTAPQKEESAEEKAIREEIAELESQIARASSPKLAPVRSFSGVATHKTTPPQKKGLHGAQNGEFYPALEAGSGPESFEQSIAVEPTAKLKALVAGMREIHDKMWSPPQRSMIRYMLQRLDLWQ